MLFLLFLFVVWTLLVLVIPLMARAARGESGGVSVFPGLPFGPLAAWGIALVLDRVQDQLGTLLVLSAHVLLLLVMAGYAVHYLGEIWQRR